MPAENYRLTVEPLDLGADVRAIALELVEQTEDKDDPAARGTEAAAVWAASLSALAGTEPWALDFFSRLDRLRDYCRDHGVKYRDAANRCVVVPSLEYEASKALLARFEAETFGFRAGRLLDSPDTPLENELAHRGVDAYHHVFQNYFACGVCDFENGSLTVLSMKLTSSEIVRRLRPALTSHPVRVDRPE
ncbi:MAG TPA: hypothetical protein VFO34_11295 [Candidatus Acidoferrales bacterium]|nr:hypothetical protein [Candidatus Acidoferrales bacterium]